MFDTSYNSTSVQNFKRRQMNEWKAEAAGLDAKGITLRQQRAEERRLALERAAEEAQTNAETGTLEVAAGEVQPVQEPSQDAEASGRHLRIGIFAALVVVLIVLWIKQKKGT